MSKYVEEVLDLAIPSRDTYAKACAPRDENSGPALRKFGLFESQKASEYAQDPQSHSAQVTPVTGKALGTPESRFGNDLTATQYIIQCTCGWRSGICESINEAFDDQFQKHLVDGKAPPSAIPAESIYVDEADAHLVASYCQTVDGVRYHAPAIDIDIPVRVRESSPGKSHLFIDKQMTEEEYFELLDAFVKVGLVEPGYVEASKRRHATYLRLPDLSKQEPPHVTLERRKAVLEDPSKALRDALEGLSHEQRRPPVPVDLF